MYIEIINVPTPNIITGCYHRHLKKSSNGMFIEKLTFIDNIFSIFFNKETQFLKKW